LVFTPTRLATVASTSDDGRRRAAAIYTLVATVPQRCRRGIGSEESVEQIHNPVDEHLAVSHSLKTKIQTCGTNPADNNCKNSLI
jgi:hypothetical protein